MSPILQGRDCLKRGYKRHSLLILNGFYKVKITGKWFVNLENYFQTSLFSHISV